MVDSQIRPNKVTDPRILDAMRRLPRERFLPAALAPLAYADQDVPLGNGRVLLQPMVIARLVQARRAAAGRDGAGGRRRHRLRRRAARRAAAARSPRWRNSDDLLRKARPALAAIARTVSPDPGTAAGGLAGRRAVRPHSDRWRGARGAADPGRATEARQSGRLVTILSNGGRTGRAVHAEPTQAGVSVRALFDCLCPILPGFVPAPAFEF